MDKSNEQLQNELENLRNIVFRIMDFNFPDLDANIKHYDFITDETVRRQLELDYLKMMQTPASNFNEYCHYSFFQIENLLNYYFTIRFKKKEELQEYFSFTNDPNVVVKTRVSEIPYSSKWSKFAQEFLQNGIIGNTSNKTINYDVQKIAYVRNSSVHRNSKEIKKYEDEMFKKYIPIKTRKDDIDNRMRRGQVIPEEEKLSEEEWDVFNKGNKIEFKRKESFSLVKKRTAEFLKIIQPEILKYQK